MFDPDVRLDGLVVDGRSRHGHRPLQAAGEDRRGRLRVVYMAEQQEPVRRQVALKVIKLGMDTKQVIARFEAERQALALMDHPNIAKVLDAGATETGRPYFVMELVRGIRITNYCDQNTWPPRRLDLFIQVCQAVQHAHERHHSPRYQAFERSGHAPRRQAGPQGDRFRDRQGYNQRLTEKTMFTSFAIVYPAYMSPEQAELSDVDIDTLLGYQPPGRPTL